MIVRKRLTLQLTPLLDMLLIIIFAQYLQVREQQIVETHSATSTVTQRDDALARIDELAAQLEHLRQSASAAQAMATHSDALLQTETARFQQSQADLDRALAQQRVLGQVMVELFQVPDQEVNRLLDPSRFPTGARTPAEMELLKEQLRTLSMQRAGKMVEHLLSYEEIRKRCDVWDLYVDAQGVATLTAGDRSTRIRVNINAAGQVESEQLINEIYTWYRTLPQPKTLVVILLTYDRASRIFVTEAVRQALPQLVARMQADNAGRIRFEYADLGFHIE